jgi:salicylate hydroxylase
VLGLVKNKNDLPRALAAYDKVRRPRALKTVEQALEIKDAYSLRLKGVEDNPEKLEEYFQTSQQWIWNLDLKKQNQDAVEAFNGPIKARL